MTYHTRAARRSVSPIDHAPKERGGDFAMLVILALVFAPIIAMHAAFMFGAAPATAAPTAAVERSVHAR